MAFYRLDLLASLQALFTVPAGSVAGHWVGDAGGSTGTGQTGPGSNNQDGFVYSESSASSDFPDQLIENSTIVALPAIMGAWAGPGRLLRLRACIAGASWLDIGEGLQIQGRASDADAWVLVALIQGWGFSNNYQQGNNIEDAGGDFLTCALDGGWVDFEFPFNDTYTQLRIRSLPDDVGGGFTYRHDAALYSIDFVDGGVAPPIDPVELGGFVEAGIQVRGLIGQAVPDAASLSGFVLSDIRVRGRVTSITPGASLSGFFHARIESNGFLSVVLPAGYEPVQNTIGYPYLYFDRGVIATESGSPFDFGLRGRSDWFEVDTSFNVDNLSGFPVAIDGSYKVEGFEFRAGRVRLNGDVINDLLGLSAYAVVETSSGISYHRVGIQGSRISILDPNNSIRDAVGEDLMVRVAIVDRKKIYLENPVAPVLRLTIGGEVIDNNFIYLDIDSTKGIHSIDPSGRIPDVGELKFRIRTETGVWEGNDSLSIFGITIVPRLSTVELALLFESEVHVLWTGIVDELKKSEEAGENQEIADVVARDLVHDISQVNFPIRCSSDGWNYTTPGSLGSRQLNMGDVVIPAGLTGALNGERMPPRTSLRYAFRNIAENLGVVLDHDFASWTESEHRRFVGVETKDQANSLVFLKDIINSEYGMLWVDRLNRIRSAGRAFWRSRAYYNDHNTVVLSDGKTSKYAITGIGDLNYKRVKVKTHSYEEIGRFRPNDDPHRAALVTENESIFTRSIDFSLADDSDPPYIVSSGAENTIEIRWEQITRDAFHGVIEEGRTEVFQNLGDYWKDYNEGRKFVGIIPVQAYIRDEGEADEVSDTEIQVEISDMVGVAVGDKIDPDNGLNGVNYGDSKTWEGGTIVANVFYNNNTLVIDFVNGSARRVAITRIIALGRMIKLARVNEIKRDFPVTRENYIDYPAIYASSSRNSCGGIGNEAIEIVNQIASQYNGRVRWPLSVQLNATRSNHAMRDAINTRIGDIVIADSEINGIRVPAIIVAEDWSMSWPELTKNVHLIPVNIGIPDSQDPSTLNLNNAGVPESPLGGSMRERNPDRNILFWDRPPIAFGSLISGYTVQGKLRLDQVWSTLGTVDAQELEHAPGGELEDWHYRVRANAIAGNSAYSGEFPNLEALNLPPTLIGSIGDLSIRANDRRTYNLLEYFDDPDGDDLLYSVVSSDPSDVSAIVVGSELQLRGIIISQGTVITVTASDGDEEVSIEFTVGVRVGCPYNVGASPRQQFTYNMSWRFDVAQLGGAVFSRYEIKRNGNFESSNSSIGDTTAIIRPGSWTVTVYTSGGSCVSSSISVG